METGRQTHINVTLNFPKMLSFASHGGWLVHFRRHLISNSFEQLLSFWFGGFGGREVCLWSDCVVFQPVFRLSFH